MKPEPLKDKMIPANYLKDYFKLKYVQETNPKFIGERDLKSAVEWLKDEMRIMLSFEKDFDSLWIKPQLKILDKIDEAFEGVIKK